MTITATNDTDDGDHRISIGKGADAEYASDASADGFFVTVLGAFTVHHHAEAVDIGGPKPTQVLAMLVANRGDVVSIETLIDALWGDDPPATARKAVQVHVSNLRRALGDSFPLKTAGSGYVVAGPAVSIDADEFERDVERAVKAIGREPAGTVGYTRRALAMWSGPAYAGVADCESVSAQVLRLTEQRLRTQTLLYDARRHLSAYSDGVRWPRPA